MLGADQVLEYEGWLFDKPVDRASARAQLLALAGRRHHLISAAVAMQDGEHAWQHTDTARPTMLALSPAFVEFYLDAVDQAAFARVGSYQLEGLGIQLFRAIDGDFFTIMGLPLLPLLDFLRERGILAA